MASPAFAHRLPSVFREPNEYQPERFQAPREEDKAAPYSYIGFGGGRHACLGQNFAYLQIKVQSQKLRCPDGLWHPSRTLAAAPPLSPRRTRPQPVEGCGQVRCARASRICFLGST